MTLGTILANGWQAPKVVELYPQVPFGTDVAKATYKYNASLARFLRLTEMAVARRSKIRAAHRRYLRKIGMPLAPLPFASKYRAKGRRK